MALIKNYGHYWNRDNVKWGKRNDSGDLKGYIFHERKPFVADFREQMGVYVLFAGNREVVYIGQVGQSEQKLFLRLRQHTVDHLRDRWTHFSWFGIREVTNAGKLSEKQKPESVTGGKNNLYINEFEAILLQLFEPRLNKQGPRWNGAIEYRQYIPSEWDGENSTTLEDLLSEIQELRFAVNKGE